MTTKAFKYIVYSILTLAPALLIAQDANQWIDYNQTYFKIKLAEDGIYRLSRQELIEAGVPVASIDPRRVQLFHNGNEQAIHIQGQSDGIFDQVDYIEFYGRRNTGETETALYRTPDAQPHPYHSLFSDSSSYFLTWNLTSASGKRRTSYIENNVTNIPAESHHNSLVRRLYTNQYHEGRSYPPANQIAISDYDYGEGWTGSAFTRNNSFDVQLNGLISGHTSGGNPRLVMQLQGRNNNQHVVDISVGPSNSSLRSLDQVQWVQDNSIDFESDLQWSDISDAGQLVVRATARGINGSADRVSVSYAQVTYPKSFEMGGAVSEQFNLRTNSSGKSFINISNVPTGLILYDISNPNDPVSVGFNSSGSSISTIIRNTSSQVKLLATSEIKQIQFIQPAAFTRIDGGFDYYIISHQDLHQASAGTSDPVTAYADYRRSTEGGAFNVLQVDIDEVFDQFGYGQPTPAAIKNLAAFFLANGDPKFLFLIGKGLSVNFNYYRQNQAQTDLINFIPTYGYPGGDLPFVSGIVSPANHPDLPIGRLNARNAQEVENYLNKVKEMESTPFDDLWRKDLIHLSGGQNISEQIQFKQYVSEFEDLAVNELLGGTVVTQSKETTEAVEILNIAGEVNDGKSLITFFGHSGTSATDIDIGFVSDPAFGFENKGRYPVILVNGCNAGNVYSVERGFGEDWVATADKGAIGFMAHSKQAFSSNLRRYTQLFYEISFTEDAFFGLSLGETAVEVSRRYLDSFGTSEASISQVEQFILLGDPAVSIFGASAPDYALEESGIVLETFDGSQLTSSADSFLIKLPVVNFAKYQPEPIEVVVNRTLSVGTSVPGVAQRVAAVRREGEVFVTLFNDPDQVNNGSNSFQIILDPNNEIAELNENNNTVNIDIFISGGSTTNLFPVDFGIVSESNVNLLVQSSNPLESRRSFTIEIDTTASFSSPYYNSVSREGNAFITFNTDLSSLQDSTVVYWRSSFTTTNSGESNDPVLSSFTYLPETNPGWAVSHNDQFKELTVTGLERDEVSRSWSFEEIATQISVITHGSEANGVDIDDIRVLVDGLNFMVRSSPTIDGFCRDNTLNMMAFDLQSTAPYKVLEFSQLDVFNNLVCGRIPQVIFNFTDNNIYDPEQANGGSRYLNRFVDNMKTDEYVLLYSIGSVNYQRWDDQVLAAVNELGISSELFQNLEPGSPFIALGRKGAAEGTAIVVVSNGSSTPTSQQVIDMQELITGKFTSGTIRTPLIGPAMDWGTLYSHITQLGDNTLLSIYGINDIGQEIRLVTNTPESQRDLAFIDPSIYPYIRLELSSTDNETFQAAQLNSWILTYQTPPEGILLSPTVLSADLEEGETLNTSFGYFNISNTPYSDSLLVDIVLQDIADQSSISESRIVASPAPGDSVSIPYSFNTFGYQGTSNLNVKALPRTGLELFTGNNQYIIPEYLTVATDKRNPVLDVAFDGVYIMDGDIVSPSPRINILVRDDNPLSLKVDTSGVNIFLKEPCEGCGFERVSLASPEVNWEPASEEKDFSVEFQPNSLQDGLYGLRVQATDASDNLSGVQPYEINFEVVNETTITHFYPYPNPFSTSTRFVFTLTGSVIPDELKIQIMTVTGRVVREILQDEIGTINIGNNISDFAWDGTDEFGDQLANGVYLYRVIVRQNGQAIDRRTTAADNAFTREFGKLYILR
ncbi:MAG: C25 family cysteine peptidase [Cyclobacteriaceae bacterium]